MESRSLAIGVSTHTVEVVRVAALMDEVDVIIRLLIAPESVDTVGRLARNFVLKLFSSIMVMHIRRINAHTSS